MGDGRSRGRNRDGWFSRLLAWIALAAFITVGGEMLARAYAWSPVPSKISARDALGDNRYQYWPFGAGDLMPNQNGHWWVWFHRPYHVQTNSLGLRNTEEPLAGASRILTVGDSQTFGPYVANEDAWPAWTEAFLRQQLGAEHPVQVFNAGIAGYTIGDELGLLKAKAGALRPGLVLLAVDDGDIEDLRRELARSQRPAHGSRLGQVVRMLGSHSALLGLAAKLRPDRAWAGAPASRSEQTGRGPTRLEQKRLAERYAELFRELVTLLANQQIPLAVLHIPAPMLSPGTRAQPSSRSFVT